MDTLLLWVGRLAGLGGVLLCVWAIYNRMGGSFSAFGFQVGTLLQAGMTAILVGCLCLLIVLTNRPPRCSASIQRVLAIGLLHARRE